MEQAKVTEMIKYRGICFENGDSLLIVPPLSTRLLEEFAETLDGVAGQHTVKSLAPFLKNKIVPMVHAGLKRNYPDITLEDVEDFVTAENWGELIKALLGNHAGAKVRVGEPFPAVISVSVPAATASATSTGTGSEVA